MVQEAKRFLEILVIQREITHTSEQAAKLNAIAQWIIDNLS